MPSTAVSRLPLGRAHMLVSGVIRDAYRAGIPATSLTPLGSLRRFSPDVGDVSLLAVAPRVRHAAVLETFARLPTFTRVVENTAATITVASDRGAVTLHLAAPEDAGAALIWHTGSRAHTSVLQQRARERGLDFDAARLTRAGGAHVETPTEQDVYRMVDLPFIAPELREGADEIRAGEAGTLPALITARDIRGDLHMHTTWSDGRDSVESMVRTARSLGYEYVALTDHSERSLASRKLRAADIPHQRAEIEDVRTRVPGIEILHGIEVDIMLDGSLDFDDRTLDAFDIVLASLHDHGGDSGERLTERYLRAIEHPLVNVITHPSNRSPAGFRGYQVDFDRLFRAAAATGTAMEIDGAPGHLDMDGTLARQAVAMGVAVVVDSDCHRADALGRQMQFGLGTARRGWVQANHVVNTRSFVEVRDFISNKRARAGASR
jgi:DNA polymerase (family 10)